jgi:phage tail sheath gpL-like
MGIVGSIPSSLRRPGVYSEFKFLASGQSLVSVPLRAAIVAEKTAAGTAIADTPVQIFDEDDADVKCGKGSLAAIMCRTALAQALVQGGLTPEIWVVPVAEPAGGTAVQMTVTFTGAATESRNLVISANGVPIVVPVNSGDSVTTISSAFKLQLDAVKHLLPYTAATAVGVTTVTGTAKGVNGNDNNFTLVTPVAGVGVAFATSVPGVGALVITNAINNLYDQRYHAVAISNHTTTDCATLVTARLDAWSYNQHNWRFFFIGERGTLGTAQTLQAAAADFGIVIGSYEQTPSLPGQIAVVDMIAEFGREAPNANMDGQRVVLAPCPGSFAYTAAEVESGLSGGVTVHTPDGPTYSKIERMVTSQTTLNAAPTETVRDIAFPRTAAYHAEQIEIGWRAGFKQESDTDDVLKRQRNMIIGIDRAMEALGYLRDVDSFLDQIQVVRSTTTVGRNVASSPFRVAGPHHQLDVINTMYL